MRASLIRIGLAALTLLVVTGCGGSDGRGDEQSQPGPTAVTAAPPAPTTAVSTTTVTSIAAVTTSAPATAATRPPVSTLGPEWVQRDGRVLIEAVASGDPHVLLRDLQALGLTEGVVFGRIINGWLPVRAFQEAQTLSTLQFVRPTGAGTG
jgi:hypothetical protein